jgi:signal transduction histidine kinase
MAGLGELPLPASATAWGLAAGPPAEEGAAGQEPQEGARSLLLVEDDAEMRRFLTSILRGHYHVVEAADGAQGLLLAQSERPALIVSDVMMPVMSGLEMLQRLRGAPETADIPVILLTARQEVEARVSGLAVGANDYLGKPFSSRELLARIDVQLRLRDAAVRAAQNERLAATGMLTSGFAHEVRNPLNGLINALAPLRESLEAGGDPTVAQEMLALIEDCGERIHHLAEALLQFVRSGERNGALDLGELLDSTLHMLGWKLTPDIEVERRYDFRGPLEGDSGELNQVWTNLLDNALRAMNGRGRLILSTTREGCEAVVRIRDTGEGIAPEVLRRLFEPFFSTRPAGQGTGLGLALSRRILHRYGGRISLRSEPGQGTECEVRLPLSRTAGDADFTEPPAP